MAWKLEGTYFENCSCDTICPCTWSGLTAPATHDRCLAMLAFYVDRGEIEGVDVGGLTFALVVDSPPVMSSGGWKLGVVLDGAATGGLTDPVRLVNVFHPANTTLTVSPATKSKVDAFGIRFDGTGTSGFDAPYAWSA